MISILPNVSNILDIARDLNLLEVSDVLVDSVVHASASALAVSRFVSFLTALLGCRGTFDWYISIHSENTVCLPIALTGTHGRLCVQTSHGTIGAQYSDLHSEVVSCPASSPRIQERYSIVNSMA